MGGFSAFALALVENLSLFFELLLVRNRRVGGGVGESDALGDLGAGGASAELVAETGTTLGGEIRPHGFAGFHPHQKGVAVDGFDLQLLIERPNLRLARLPLRLFSLLALSLDPSFGHAVRDQPTRE